MTIELDDFSCDLLWEKLVYVRERHLEHIDFEREIVGEYAFLKASIWANVYSDGHLEILCDNDDYLLMPSPAAEIFESIRVRYFLKLMEE